jgi:hypothetical protein
MNCANHPDAAVAQYCRTCGKPLCANCTRAVHGVTYCENCLDARLEGVQPPQTAYPQVVDEGMGMKVPPAPGSGPNAALAGILAGFFPFGVGAVYTGQYAKGLAHLVTFAVLVWGASSARGGFETVFGLGIAFFYVYQIIDAVRSAKAIQMGQPAPDPFGLAQAFGAGEKVDTAKVPMAAIVLIGLGVLFLLHTMGGWFFSLDRFWPVILIGLGIWLFAKRWGLMGASCDRYGRRCRTGSVVGPAVLVTVGALSLIENLDGPGWGRTWPVLLLVIGLTKLLQRQIPSSSGVDAPPPIPGGAGPIGVQGEVQPPSSEVKHG